MNYPRSGYYTGGSRPEGEPPKPLLFTRPPSVPLTDHLTKLYRIANGALNTLERQAEPRAAPTVRKQFWDGYLAALDDVSHFARQEGLCD